VQTPSVLAQWQEGRSERRPLRYVAHHWRGYFPRQLSQRAFNRRARDPWDVRRLLGPAQEWAATGLLGGSTYEVVDGVPVPLMRRCRGDRHRLFGAAGFPLRGPEPRCGFV
jgi:hypothetical protein